MVGRDDAETRRILDDVVLLAVPANPDGLDLVADWYMREKEPSKRSMNGVPVLYQKYIGHDNNRDFYMNTQAETKAMSRQLYIEWHPQILYNHHQTGPAGTVLFAPPFRDPFNYAFDPLIPVGLDLVSASMHNRFVTEDKPGATMRSGAGYSTWWNGGLRSTGYFHNVIGILTEAIGNPTPIDIPFIPERLLPKHDYPYPVAPQKWHFRQSVEYAITADMAILDVASKHREDFLYRRYLMGRHAIELGSKDSWTVVPGTIAEVRAAVERDSKSAGGPAQAQAPGQAGPGGGFGRARGVDKKYYDGIFDKAKRDPRGYIIPSDQADFPTAVKFVNALLESGIAVERAKADFEVAGRRYPKDSFVVRTAQAFRPHVMTMFEPQDHPNDIPYPGGAPNPPYDAAGWTLAYQMGVAFDRVLDAFGGPFERVPGVTKPPAGVFDAGDGRGRLSPRPPGQRFVHRRQPAPQGRREGPVAEVRRILGPGLDGRGGHPPESGEGAGVERRRRGGRAEGRGVRAEAAAHRAVGFVRRLDGLGLDPLAPRAVRIPLRARLRAGARCGRPRIPVRRAHPRRRLRPPRPGPGTGRSPPAASGIFQMPAPANVPEEYKNRIGRISAEKTVPVLRQFVEAGGTILALDSATVLAEHFKLPLANALVEKAQDGKETPLRSEKFYVPGSILRARVDPSHPLAHGLAETIDVFYDNTPAFTLLPDAELKGVSPVVWFDDGRLLRSGWAWGEGYLRRSVQVAEAVVGKGKVFLFGPEIAFRGQPHGTFKLLFNGLYYGPAAPVELQ